MFGSLNQYINLSKTLTEYQFSNSKKWRLDSAVSSHSVQIKLTTKHKKNIYAPDDKSNLLSQYQRRFEKQQNKKRAFMRQNKFKINHDAIKNPRKQLSKPKALSLLTKTQLEKDKIARQQLSRNHQLLRAIIRTQQAEMNFRNKTDFEQSIQRMKQGYRKIIKNQTIRPSFFSIEEKKFKHQRGNSHEFIKPVILKEGKINQQKIRLNNSLKWAKKHNLIGKQILQKMSTTVQNKKQEIIPFKKRLTFYQNKKILQKINAQMQDFGYITEY